MNFKQLNEAIEKLLHEEQLYELSPQLKDKVKDIRHAQYLAAEADVELAKERADKARAKYNKHKYTKISYKQAVQDLKVKIQDIFNLDSYEIEDLYLNKGAYCFDIIINADYKDEKGNVKQSLLDELQSLLDEMSKKYNVKYSYIIDNGCIKILSEKPKEVEKTFENRKAKISKYDFILTCSDKDIDLLQELKENKTILDGLNAGADNHLIGYRTNEFDPNLLEEDRNYYGVCETKYNTEQCYLGWSDSDEENRCITTNYFDYWDWYSPMDSYNEEKLIIKALADLDEDEEYRNLSDEEKYKKCNQFLKSLKHKELVEFEVDLFNRHQNKVNDGYYIVHYVTFPELI